MSAGLLQSRVENNPHFAQTTSELVLATASAARYQAEMHLNFRYADEKLYLAVRALATMAAPIQERLRVALLELVVLRPIDFPPELAAELESIWEDAGRPARPDQSIDAIVAVLTEAQSEDIARRMFDLYLNVRDHEGEEAAEE